MRQREMLGRVLLTAAGAGVIAAGVWGFSVIAPGLGRFCTVTASISLGQPLSVQDEPPEQIGLVIGAPVSRGSGTAENTKEEQTEEPADEPKAVKSCEIPSEKPSADILKAIPYPESLERHDGPIEKMHYGRYTASQFIDLAGGGQVFNRTSVPNATLLAESVKPVDFETSITEGEPLVLIYHTHTTESFEPCDRDFYDGSFYSKTTDPERNMTAVGNRICEQLDKAGIPYIHDTLVHDYESYNGAYDSSRATVQALLKKYPSVKIALDIHRDGLQTQDGTRLSPVVTVNGREAAQIMIISGCDDGTMGMPDYIKNFHFACALQSKLETLFPGLTRPILFDYRHYNQDLTTGSLLIEVGSHGNSLEQALYAGELVGEGLCRLIKEQ